MLSLDLDTYRCAGYSRSACITLGALVSLKKINTFTNDFSAIFILFYSFDSQMCDTVEDGEERKPAREQFRLYNGSSNNVRLRQFSLPR